MFFPWPIRSFILRLFFGCTIHKSAKIGFSLVFPEKIFMGPNTSIGHLNVIKGVNLDLSEHSVIGNLNWISGIPISCKDPHYTTNVSRCSQLILKSHAAITNRHWLDCTDSITVGQYSIMAGFRSQFLTHSISLAESVQKCSPVVIGDYSFVGTGVIVLHGSRLPSYSVLGAGAVLNKPYEDMYCLYAGNPARLVKKLDMDMTYFSRTDGYVE